MTVGPLAALVVRTWDLLDSQQLDRLDEVFAPDARFGAGPGAVTGPAAIANLVLGHYRAFPQTSHQHVRSLEGDGVACVEGLVAAVHSGTLRSPVGDIAATGRRIEWPATVWVEVADDRIVSWTTAYDTLAVLTQLGAR